MTPAGFCDRCGESLLFHEREAHPQAYCHRCAVTLKIARLCDQPGPDAAAISERVVSELLDQKLVGEAQAEAAARAARTTAEIAKTMASLGPLGPGDIIRLTISGERVSDVDLDHSIEELMLRCPEKFLAPVIVVPRGWLGRCIDVATRAGMIGVLDCVIEASEPNEIAKTEPPRPPAMEIAFQRWFDRDDVSDDELTDILAEHGCNGDEVQEILQERQARRDVRGDPMLIDVKND